MLDLTGTEIEQVLRHYVDEHRQEVRAAVENLWNKYGVSLATINAERAKTERGLEGFLRELGYV